MVEPYAPNGTAGDSGLRALRLDKPTTILALNLGGIRVRQIPNLDIPDLPGAVCKGIDDITPFHPTKPEVNTDVAKAMCGGCPVKQKCYDWCIDWERRNGEIQGGIWGGTTEWERKANATGIKSFCQSGRHEMIGDNVRVSAKGKRRCRICINETNARIKREARAAKGAESDVA